MKVLKSWGADGQVILSLTAEAPRDWESQEPVFIEFDGLPVPFFAESVQPRGSRLIVKFEDVDTLAQAEELVGREVRFRGETETQEDTLTGLRVCDNRTRRIIGRIVDEADYGGNWVITVETPERDILLPLHEDLIVSIHEDIITLAIPDGLL